MATTIIVKPLGLVLQTAGLVSPGKVRIALKERLSSSNYRLGEIMARQGWISQQTADFFAEQWPQLPNREVQQPLGQYLKAANLIDDSQIETILQEQTASGLKFGEAAVLKEIISQTTLNFFLEQLELFKSSQDGDDLAQNLRIITDKQLAHWNNIENYLLYNRRCEPKKLFNLYRQIWRQGEIPATNSRAEQELLKSGLVAKDHNKIQLAPSIDRQNFSDSWIENQLVRLQPYSKIKIKLFNLDIKASLPYKVLIEVQAWTNGQSFLTHKIYQIIRDRESFIPRNQETKKVSQLVQQYIIDDWENNLAASHLISLRSQLLNAPVSLNSLLLSYQEIWHHQPIAFNQTPEQECLLTIGLIKLDKKQVRIANRIYHDIFNDIWLKQQIIRINQSISSSKQNQDLNSPLKHISNNVKPKNLSILVKVTVLLLCIASVNWVGFLLTNQYFQTQHFKQANDLLAQQKYHAAIAAYDRLLQTKPRQQHLLWTNRGYAMLGLSRYNDMLQSCFEATSIKPQAAFAWNCRGEALYYLTDYENALQAFEQATKINAKEATFWLNKSQVLSELQKYQQAIAASEQAIKLIKSSQSPKLTHHKLAIAFNQKGQNLLKINQDQEALTAFIEALTNSPNHLSAQQGQGIAFYRLGHYQEAIRTFEQVLTHNNLSSEQKAMSWLYTGVSFCEAQKFKSAEQAFKQVMKLTTNRQSQKIAQAGCGIR
jgi:tetratricopeptide (TPR) repeat protein